MFKWILRKILERCFRQGNNSERRMFYQTMLDVIEEHYAEDNAYSQWYWIVEEMLRADDRFNKLVYLKDAKISMNCIKNGLGDVVDVIYKSKNGILK